MREKNVARTVRYGALEDAAGVLAHWKGSGR